MVISPQPIALQPIGIVQSPLTQKFGAPRQPNLVAVQSYIHMLSPYDTQAAFAGLSDFSHIWLLWHFHANSGNSNTYRPQIRPPRLGGNAKIGVFASRSMYRPNPIGLSVVKLVAVSDTTPVVLTIEGADLIHGTPIVDIKPYIHYSDSLPDATSSYAQFAPTALAVEWQAEAVTSVQRLIQQQLLQTNDSDIISQLLAQNPRPAYHDNSNPNRGGKTAVNSGHFDQSSAALNSSYGMRYRSVNIRFSYISNASSTTIISVEAVEAVNS